VGAEGRQAAPAAIREPVSTPVRLSPLEGYRLWSRTWETDPSAIVALESRFLAPWISELRGKVLIDLSCGAGRWLTHARRQGAAVFGADICREMLTQASQKAGLPGRLAMADTRAAPFADRCADVAICALSLGHISPIEPAVAELARIVRPGGTLVISDFHPQAIVRGWRRTFRSNGELFEIESHPYSKDRLLECASADGLVLQEMLEPCFGEPEKKIFERAGKQDLFEQVRGIPAVLAARWTRP
jgi:ubiquinone/menaquinone biosynthesis C-methylase UbiE